MSRPKKQTVDYFPHYCNHGKTMFVLEQKYGNDGYAFWFKLLEIVGNTEGHCPCFNNGIDWQFLEAKTRLDKNSCNEIMDLLATIEAIDKDLWLEEKRVWIQNFVDNVKDAYRNRVVDIPDKPIFLRNKSHNNKDKQGKKTVNETKLNETKENNINIIEQIITYLNEKAETNYKATTRKTQDLIKARINEKFTLEDFKTVIDKKVKSWMGTEWQKYLRPETLFGTKFEGYLNEKEKVMKKFKNERIYTDDEQRAIDEKFYS
jgi:uncharacterized phage protein (TIGR02220 family)